MFRVVIVDDERFICEGLTSIIKRLNKAYIGEIVWFTSANEAIEHIRTQGAEILVTDIYMPEKNGLQVISEVKELDKNIKMIVLSGYDDYQYVKGAYKKGVCDYLKKPVDAEELSAVLDEVYTQFKETPNEKKTEIVVKYALGRIFSNEEAGSYGEEMEGLENSVAQFFQKAFFAVAVIRSHIAYLGEIEKKIFKELSQNPLPSVQYFGTIDHQNQYVIVLNFNDQADYDEILKRLSRISKEIDMQGSDMDAVFGISSVENDARQIGGLYKDAESATRYACLFEKGRMIPFEAVKGRRGDCVDESKKALRLTEAIRIGNIQGSNSIVEEIFNKKTLDVMSEESMERLFVVTINSIITALPSVDAEMQALSSKRFDSFRSLSDLIFYLKSLILATYEKLKTDGNQKNIVELAKEYIAENYNKNISLVTVSNYVSMSYTYFSKLFHDKIGMNFSDYLCNVRMEEAARLMKNPTNKIQQVASMVGYSNPKHFTRAFKKHFGKSPREYRAD